MAGLLTVECDPCAPTGQGPLLALGWSRLAVSRRLKGIAGTGSGPGAQGGVGPGNNAIRGSLQMGTVGPPTCGRLLATDPWVSIFREILFFS